MQKRLAFQSLIVKPTSLHLPAAARLIVTKLNPTVMLDFLMCLNTRNFCFRKQSFVKGNTHLHLLAC